MYMQEKKSHFKVRKSFFDVLILKPSIVFSNYEHQKKCRVPKSVDVLNLEAKYCLQQLRAPEEMQSTKVSGYIQLPRYKGSCELLSPLFDHLMCP